MKNALLLFTLISILAFSVADAIPRRMSRDMKLPSQVLLEKQTITDAILADDNRLLATQATSASVITTVTTLLAQPDVCRALSITPGTTTADVPAGNITVTGLNIKGRSMSEAFTLTANQSSVENGVEAFCSVSSIVFPVQDGADATYDVGVIDVLGLKQCTANTGHIGWAVFDGTFEGTRPTCVSDVDEVEKNTCDINGTLDGAKDIEVFFVQNFGCL